MASDMEQDVGTPSADSMETLLRSGSLGPHWKVDPPLPEDEFRGLLARVPASRRDLPPDLMALYRHTAGGDIGWQVFLLGLEDVVDDIEATYGEFLDEEMPSMFLFGRDNAGGGLFTDTDGSLGSGVGAVYYCGFGGFDPESSALCAPSVTALLERTTRGEFPWHGKGRY